MPQLVILAGPNGSGKTTLVHSAKIETVLVWCGSENLLFNYNQMES